jgi:glutamate formiminotransferase/formiminotetrahydrofolate cyclodeaminase
MTHAGNLLDLSVREFLDRAADRTPTPGGGSVAALVGALGTTMAQMTARYTIGNPKHAAAEPVVRAWLGELERARAAFCELLAEDVAAYERYSNAGKDLIEKAKALATATAVPLEITAVAAAVIDRMDGMKDKCNRNLLSDLVVGAILCDAAAAAAGANVRINLAGFADRAEADRIARELDAMLARTRARRDSIQSFADKKA